MQVPRICNEQDLDMITLPLNKEDVNESICLFDCLFSIYFNMANPNELKFLGMIPLGMQMVLD